MTYRRNNIDSTGAIIKVITAPGCISPSPFGLASFFGEQLTSSSYLFHPGVAMLISTLLFIQENMLPNHVATTV